MSINTETKLKIEIIINLQKESTDPNAVTFNLLKSYNNNWIKGDDTIEESNTQRLHSSTNIVIGLVKQIFFQYKLDLCIICLVSYIFVF